MVVFRELINFGVDYVMIGHLLFPKIDKRISSISSYWIRDVLRKRLMFKGRVITDDLSMDAFKNTADIQNENLFDELGIDGLIVTEREHPLLRNLVRYRVGI